MSFIFPGTGNLGYGYGGYFFPSGFLPSELLDNPWVIFIVFFAIFFSVSYFSLSRTLGGKGGSKAPPMIISVALAFLMAAGIQGFWPEYSRLILIVSLIIFAGVLLLFLFGKGKNVIGGILIIASFVLWLWPLWSDGQLVSPYFLASLPTGFVYFLDTKSWIFFWIFVASILFVTLTGKGGKE